MSGFRKEIFSEYSIYVLKDLEQNDNLNKPKKDHYTINEIVEIENSNLSAKDREIFTSNKTCSYYFFGRYFIDFNRSKYTNITDKNIFNASQFDDMKNLIQFN